MRPLKLKVKGFTAFREEQSVDFSGLDLFAIAGPTGAGKSSILDAMTYALYGQVERVTKECAQLISQGLPAMAVEFEFACGSQRYRIARRTYRRSPTDVVLERFENGEWRSEAGKVREVAARIEEIIGLDYDGFTRAVLLPQGKFDQFLTGDAAARRRILTDLLGLQIFDRMAGLARKLASAAEVQIKTTRGFLETEFKDVSPESIDAARAEVTSAKKREQDLDVALVSVRAIESTWKQARQRARDLQSCADEAGGYANTARAAAVQIRKLSTQLTAAKAALAAKAKELVAAETRATKADAARAAAVKKFGAIKDLAAGKAKAEQLVAVRRELDKARKTLSDVQVEPSRLQVLVATAAAAVERAIEAERQAKNGAAAARTELDEVQHDERIAAIAADLRVGQPCPICGAKLTKLPAPGPTAVRLKSARAALATAEGKWGAAREFTAKALLKAAELTRKVEAAADAVDRARTGVTDQEKRITSLEKELGSLFGTKLPPDPVSSLRERIATLEALEADADSATAAKRACERAASEAERLCERLADGIVGEANRVPTDAVTNLRKRVVKLLPGEQPEAVAAHPRQPTPEQRATAAEDLADRMKELAARVSKSSRDELSAEPKHFTEANRIVGGLVPRARDLEALVIGTVQVARAATRAAAESEKAAENLVAALVRKLKLIAGLVDLEQRAERLHSISLDLRSDAIVDFLQAQALEGLALEGSTRLRQLSVERYELRYRDDEFYVADTWNGDEERSVKTLSGGETFLASLALALSLSGQVRSLSSVEHAQLDSLFLDEGFASLDREAVDLVIAGLERLGADGRIVGVITHMREITDQFPRIEVEKLPTGSRISVVA